MAHAYKPDLRLGLVHSYLRPLLPLLPRHGEVKATGVGVEVRCAGACGRRDLFDDIVGVAVAQADHGKEAFAARGVEAIPLGVEPEIVHAAGDLDP